MSHQEKAELEFRDKLIERLGDAAIDSGCMLIDAQTGRIVATPQKMVDALYCDNLPTGGDLVSYIDNCEKFLALSFGLPKTVSNEDGSFTHTFTPKMKE